MGRLVKGYTLSVRRQISSGDLLYTMLTIGKATVYLKFAERDCKYSHHTHTHTNNYVRCQRVN